MSLGAIADKDSFSLAFEKCLRNSVCMDSEKDLESSKKSSDEVLTIVHFSELEREQQLITLIANIIVDKILRHAGEKGNSVSQIQPRQTELS